MSNLGGGGGGGGPTKQYGSINPIECTTQTKYSNITVKYCSNSMIG